jgi:thiamine biosynthesis lipoprotein
MLLIFPLFSCTEGYPKINFICFSSDVEIATKTELPKSLEAEIKDTLFSFDSSLSVNGINSLINAFNSLEMGETPELNYVAEEVLSIARKIHDKTGGAFDPTVYPLVKLWKFNAGSYRVADFTPPTDEEISNCLEKVGLDGIDSNYKKLKNGIELDLGGILKGYGANRVAEILASNGITEGYINIGGSSLYILGSSILCVKHPENKGSTLFTINEEIINTAVSTSGNYQRFYEHKGVRYSHIINPKTGRPTNTGIISVTVLASDGAEADALSTALCTFTKKEIINFISNNPEYTIFAVYQTEKQIITSYNLENIKLNDSSYTLVKV